VTTAAEPLTLAVWKFASCDGCQLTLLGGLEHLLAAGHRIRIAHFLEASSAIEPGPYDLSLVEGSVTTEEDAARIRRIRDCSRVLVTVGACATAGGVQALRNSANIDAFRAAVYPHPEYISSLDRSTPISAHVAVDVEIPGCPIDAGQLLDSLAAIVAGRRPPVTRYAVCQECKLRGVVCLPVSRGVACLGPITRAGCGAVCPAIGRGCFGCFGPVPGANDAAMTAHLRALGLHDTDLARLAPFTGGGRTSASRGPT
jgi:sulfhydrogenase subunit delta